jgi:hypothetical protein
MQRLHRTVGVLSGSAKLAVSRESTGRAIRPHIASRISNVLSINHHKRFIGLKIQSLGPLIDRDEIGYAPVPKSPCPRNLTAWLLLIDARFPWRQVKRRNVGFMGTRDVGEQEICRFEAIRQRVGDRT